MHKTLNFYLSLILFLIITAHTNAQSAEEYYRNGIKKAASGDYNGAIIEFDKAVQTNPYYALAYYNRGLAKNSLGYYDEAIADIDKSIELKAGSAKTFLSRGMIKFNKHDFENALKDFNSVIVLETNNATAYYYSGYCKLYLNIKDACYDLIKAGELGEPKAKELLDQYCVKSTSSVVRSDETLMIEWPASEGWHIFKEDDNQVRRKVEFRREGETLLFRAESGAVYFYKNINASMKIPISKSMDLLYEDVKKNCNSAVLMVLEKNENTKYPRIIFKIECELESQIWCAVQGTDQLFAANWGIKGNRIPPELQEKWIKIFKSANIILK